MTANQVTQEAKGLWGAGMCGAWIEKYAIKFRGEDMLTRHIGAAPPGHFYATNLDLDAADFTASRLYRVILKIADCPLPVSSSETHERMGDG